MNLGKPAMIYFSKQPAAPDTIDPDQYRALTQFRTWCETQGLVEPFFGPDDFTTKLRRHIQIVIQKNDYLRSIVHSVTLSRSDAARLADAAPLSPEAVSLLLAAAKDAAGTVLTLNAMAGRIITAGQRQFGTPDDRRAMAKWDYGLEQLITVGLVEESGGNGHDTQIFQLTAPGYRVADSLANQKTPA